MVQPSSQAKKRKFSGIFSEFKGRLARTPLQKEYYNNLRIILSNNLNRLIFLFLDVILIGLLLYLLSISLDQTANTLGQLVFLLFFLALLYTPAAYLYRSYVQLDLEVSLNSSIYDALYCIDELRKPKTIKNYRSFQSIINTIRKNLKDFVEYSEILSPPIFNYELDRLQKRIDIFFNCASEVLVPIDKLFSRAEEFELEIAEAEADARSPESLSEEEALAMEEERMREMTGEIANFDLRAMNEFMHYLRAALFEKEAKRYPPLSFKHPVNLIVLSKFFDRWNSVISSCSNSKEIFEKANKDIENYYKQLGRIQSKRRQQMWQLRDEVLIVILSVGISTLIQYLIEHI